MEQKKPNKQSTPQQSTPQQSTPQQLTVIIIGYLLRLQARVWLMLGYGRA